MQRITCRFCLHPDAILTVPGERSSHRGPAMRAKQQQQLPFDGKREQTRLDTIERLFGTDKRVQTAAKFFDEQGEREAERLAKRTAPDTKSVAQ